MPLFRYRYTGDEEEYFGAPVNRTVAPGEEVESDVELVHGRLELIEPKKPPKKEDASA